MKFLFRLVKIKILEKWYHFPFMTENFKFRKAIYIIRILQHFATKLWNITNFVMLFQAVMKFLSRLFEIKILVNWGMVHCR